MKFFLIIASILLVGCSNAVIASADYEDDVSSSYDAVPQMHQSSASEAASIEKHYFPTDLEYVVILRTQKGAELVLKNNTEYAMLVEISYEITCSANGKPAQTSVKTRIFSFASHEQKGTINSVNGYLNRGMETIECSGSILSIYPFSSDHSDFQPWEGSYPISTK